MKQEHAAIMGEPGPINNKITSVTVTNVNRNFGDKVKEISQTADQVVNKT